MDCGPTCLRMVAKHHGKIIQPQKIRRLCENTKTGSSLQGLSDAADKLGLRSIGVKINYEKLKNEVPLPCIAFFRNNHFVVVYEIKGDTIYVADPAFGLLKYSEEEFLQNWIVSEVDKNNNEGVVLILDPTPEFYSNDDEVEEKLGFSFLLKYVYKYKKLLIQLSIGLLCGSILQLIFPFLTQSVVDVGIQNQNIDFIYLILIAQLFLFFGKVGVEIIRGWILLHLSTRINISLISDFFVKLMKLPISFFDSKMTGDIMQRINDHQKIESLLTSTSLSVLFSTLNLFVFGAVLAFYDLSIFTIFVVGSTLYFLWAFLFLKKRKTLDYKRFSESSTEQSKVFELITGMQEIKLNNAEKQKRWSWEYVQAALFKIEVQTLKMEQIQSIGSNFLEEVKNILITIMSAKLVIEGDLTLGMMLSISYIMGQLTGPVQQLIGFVYAVQDAKIALERLSEIHDKEDEENGINNEYVEFNPKQDIVISDLNYKYPGADEDVLKDVNLHIPKNKVTAIVGASGSGKTTLMKILLKFYSPKNGHINVGALDLENLSHKLWREECGTVMQEGYIFNDSIAKNITLGYDDVDIPRLREAARVANIHDFIEELPLSYNTKIGMEGVGLSTGQKQRILIARAVYKDPNVIFFDEATSALDANNERVIMRNLDEFFKERTAVVIAHRLSTIKNADQIVVLEKGEIIEKGNHKDLLEKRGRYFHLVKNQLELEKINNENNGR